MPPIGEQFDDMLLKIIFMCIVVSNASAAPNCTRGETDSKYPKCSALLMGQYRCEEPEIDHQTQQAVGCGETRVVQVKCMPAPEVVCIPDKTVSPSGDPCYHDGEEVGFYREVPCRWTNGYKFETSLLLSIFLGMFGIDRFYLGYPAMGLLKFSTFGFFFLGQLIDVLLIATQTVTPSDGSDYVIDYYGAGIVKLSMNNETIIKLDDYT